jgi:predicted ATPase
MATCTTSKGSRSCAGICSPMADALLRRVERDPAFPWPDPPVFPFTLPAVSAFDALELHPEVTFLVGENGSGKSTLLEAIAAKLDLDVEGGDRDLRFEDREADTILLAYPDALIYELRPEGPVPTAYEDTDHYRLTRAFLNAPDRFLRELFS